MSRDAIIKYAAIAIFVVVNAYISLAMVIAPTGSDAATNANLYKGASLLLGLLVLWLAVRQNRYALLVAFAMLQLLAFGSFSEALNSVP